MTGFRSSLAPHDVLHAPDPSEIDTQSDTLRSGHPCDSWTPPEAKVREFLSKMHRWTPPDGGWIGGNRAFNQGVAGSIPARPTNRINNLREYRLRHLPRKGPNRVQPSPAFSVCRPTDRVHRPPSDCVKPSYRWHGDHTGERSSSSHHPPTDHDPRSNVLCDRIA